MLSGSGAASNHGGSETLELENVFKMYVRFLVEWSVRIRLFKIL